MVRHKRDVSRNIFAIIGLTCGNLLFFLTIWLANKYDHVSLDQFVYQMKSPAVGSNTDLVNSVVVRVILLGIAVTCAEIALYLFCSGFFRKRFRDNRVYLKFCASKLCRFITKRALPIAMAILLFSTCFFVAKLDVIGYVDDLSTESGLIEKHYVDPYSVELAFPENKRNLIYIFLESMEVTFSDTDAGSPIYDNFIPELTKLAENNINFSNDDTVGGAYSFTGTTWTAAAMVAQTSGVIVQVPLTANTYGGENQYMPGLVSIGEILEDAGYHQTLLVGSDAAFAGRDSYFSEHGNYEIVDINSLKEQGRLEEDYLEFWGYEDLKLYRYAKEELTRLAQLDQPFNFTMLTCDSHFPDGYYCQLCGNEYSEQYPNVLRCSSRQLMEFISWVKEQPFYEDTTIVISGDHLTMDPDFLEDVDANYTRTIYNCIINSPITPINEKNREFGTFDMFPTTLAALGVNIEGDRLGLGTNLFSDKATLTEHYGFDILDNEFQKKSTFYNTTFLGMKANED